MKFTAAATLLTVAMAVLPTTAAGAAGGPARPFDFNGDGRKDRAVGNTDGAGKVTIRYGTRKQVITRSSPGIPGKPRKDDEFGGSLASADFDRDGYADLVISQPTEALWAKTKDVLIVYGGRRGLTSRVAKLKRPDGLPVNGDVQVAEFGPKGRPDLLVFGNSGYVLYQNPGAKPKAGGAVPYGEPQYSSPGQRDHPVSTELKDFTGDGYTDLVLIRPRLNDSQPFQQLTLRRGSAKGLGPEQRFGPAAPGATIAGDFNGDGVQDLIAQTGPGGVSFFAGSRKGLAEPVPLKPTVGRRSPEFGAYSLEKGDINGDKVPDLAIGDHNVPTSLEYAPGAVTVLYGGKNFLAFRGAQYFPADTPGFNPSDFSIVGDDVALFDVTKDRRADLLIVVDDFSGGEWRTIAIPSVKGRLDPAKLYELKD